MLIGDVALCERHWLALAAFGIHNVRVANQSGPARLWRIAEATGLVPRSA